VTSKISATSWLAVLPCLVAYMNVLADHKNINLNHLNNSKQDFTNADISKHKNTI
jgi:hypothetical protein